MANGSELWGRRLKEIRLERGLSQKALGIEAGLDPFVASTRINRYELGVHKADLQIAKKLGEILDVPTAYFYAEDDREAEILTLLHRSSSKKKGEVLKLLRA